MRIRASLLLVLLATLPLLAGCRGGSSSATPTQVSAQSLFDDASQRFQQVNSFHFALDLAGNVALDSNGTIKLHGSDGDLLRPDRAQAKADVSFGGANLSISLIAIGTDQYITNILTGRWEKAPADLGYNPAILFDNDRGIAGVLRKVQNPTLLGSDTVGGVKTYHLSGQVANDVVAPMTANTIKAQAVDFEIWIGQDNHDIYKLVLKDPTGQGGATPTTWTLLISKHNSPVTIERPNV